MRTTIIFGALASLLLVSGCMMPDRDEQVAKNEAKLAAEGYTILEPGVDKAPAVEVAALDGTVLLSADGEPAGWIQLFFVTAVDTPNAAKEVHKLNRMAAELSAAEVTTAIVLPAPPGLALDYKAEHCPDLTVVADPELEISIPYGCAIDGADYLQRTLIGVAGDGSIAFFERGFPWHSAKQILEEGFGIATIEE